MGEDVGSGWTKTRFTVILIVLLLALSATLGAVPQVLLETNYDYEVRRIYEKDKQYLHKDEGKSDHENYTDDQVGGDVKEDTIKDGESLSWVQDPPMGDKFNLRYLYSRLYVEPKLGRELEIDGTNSEKSGWNVTLLDFNGNGQDDVVIGAPEADNGGSVTGAVYIFFDSSLSNGVSLGTDNADVTIYGASGGDEFGWSVGNASDWSGNSEDDLVVGAPGAGEAYVFEGGTLTGGTYSADQDADVTITGNSGDEFGSSVGGGSTLTTNKNVFVGGPGAENDRGRVYVYEYGSGSDKTTSDSVLNITGKHAGDSFGHSLAGIRSVSTQTGDQTDLIVGAPYAPEDNSTGRAYVFYGGHDPSGEWNLSVKNANFTLVGEEQNDMFGWSVFSAGDVNDDNYGDVVVGAPGWENDKGRGYVYLGDSDMDMSSTLSDGSGNEIKSDGTNKDVMSENDSTRKSECGDEKDKREELNKVENGSLASKDLDERGELNKAEDDSLASKDLDEKNTSSDLMAVPAANYTVDVSNVDKVRVELWGAGGSGSGNGDNDNEPGGDGGYAKAKLDVSTFDTLKVWEGQPGSKGDYDTNYGGWGRSSGGAGGREFAGSGAGSTEIWGVKSGGEEIFLAAADGGGGGGMAHSSTYNDGGGGGGAGGIGGVADENGEDAESNDRVGYGGDGGDATSTEADPGGPGDGEVNSTYTYSSTTKLGGGNSGGAAGGPDVSGENNDGEKGDPGSVELDRWGREYKFAHGDYWNTTDNEEHGLAHDNKWMHDNRPIKEGERRIYTYNESGSTASVYASLRDAEDYDTSGGSDDINNRIYDFNDIYSPATDEVFEIEVDYTNPDEVVVNVSNGAQEYTYDASGDNDIYWSSYEWGGSSGIDSLRVYTRFVADGDWWNGPDGWAHDNSYTHDNQPLKRGMNRTYTFYEQGSDADIRIHLRNEVQRMANGNIDNEIYQGSSTSFTSNPVEVTAELTTTNEVILTVEGNLYDKVDVSGNLDVYFSIFEYGGSSGDSSLRLDFPPQEEVEIQDPNRTLDVSGVAYVEAKLAGAGGGGGREDPGGSGGLYHGVLDVSGFDKLKVWEGEAGEYGGKAGWGRYIGGDGGGSFTGGGGGSTEIVGEKTDGTEVWLAAADAGGGAGDGDSYTDGGGGGARGGDGGAEGGEYALGESGKGSGDPGGGDGGSAGYAGGDGGYGYNSTYHETLLSSGVGLGSAGGTSSSDGTDGYVKIWAYEITSLTNPGEVECKGTVDINVGVKNVGDTQGDADVQLDIDSDGNNNDTKTVTLAPGASTTVTLTYDHQKDNDLGTLYDVLVGTWNNDVSDWYDNQEQIDALEVVVSVSFTVTTVTGDPLNSSNPVQLNAGGTTYDLWDGETKTDTFYDGESYLYPQESQASITDHRWRRKDVANPDPYQDSFSCSLQDVTIEVRYYEQYEVTFKANDAGSCTHSRPTINVDYDQFNNNLGSTGTVEFTDWVDSGGNYEYDNPISTGTAERWSTDNPTGTISDSTTINKDYYHQYQNTVGVDVENCDDSFPENNALRFDGNDDYVEAPDLMEGKGKFTFSAWVKAEDLTSDRTIVGDWGSSDSSQLFYYDVGDDSWRWLSSGNDDTGFVGGPVETGKWYHLTLSYDGGGDFMLLVNGDTIFSASTSDSSIPSSTSGLQIGGDYGSHPEWNGIIDDVRMYDSALSKGEIEDLYENRYMELGGELAWYPMNEGSGNTAYDESGNSNDGTINGASWSDLGGVRVSYTQFGRAGYSGLGAGLTTDQTEIWADCESTMKWDKAIYNGSNERWNISGSNEKTVNSGDNTWTKDYWHQYYLDVYTRGGYLDDTYNTTLYWHDMGGSMNSTSIHDSSPVSNWMDCGSDLKVDTPVDGPGPPDTSRDYTYVCDDNETIVDNMGTQNYEHTFLFHAEFPADVTFDGPEPNARFGWSVSGAADFDGSNNGDIAIGAPGVESDTGKAYYFYSNGQWAIGDEFIAGSADVIREGENAGDEFGYSLSGPGDVLGHGVDSVLVGAPYRDIGGTNDGRTYLFELGEWPKVDLNFESEEGLNIGSATFYPTQGEKLEEIEVNLVESVVTIPEGDRVNMTISVTSRHGYSDITLRYDSEEYNSHYEMGEETDIPTAVTVVVESYRDDEPTDKWAPIYEKNQEVEIRGNVTSLEDDSSKIVGAEMTVISAEGEVIQPYKDMGSSISSGADWKLFNDTITVDSDFEPGLYKALVRGEDSEGRTDDIYGETNDRMTWFRVVEA